MSDRSEIYNLLLLLNEVSKYTYPAIHETASRRLRELEDEAAERLAAEKLRNCLAEKTNA